MKISIASETELRLTMAMEFIIDSFSTNMSIWSSTVRNLTHKSMKNLSVLGNKFSQRCQQVKLPNFNFKLEVEDWFSVEGFCYLSFIIIIAVCMFIISLNIYRKIRYAIPATVNCWFCNANVKVLYSLRETWTCPKCQQYNGFNADGNYNKRIPAQFIEALNRPIRGCSPQGQPAISSFGSSNGLCSQCNLNQVLKVFQLSSFVPVNEKNYDAEIEAETKRLEQLYDICTLCKTVVEDTLKRTPGREEFSTARRRVKVNKVTPSSPNEGDCRARHDVQTFNPDKVYQELRKVSDGSESGSASSFLSLNNLKIHGTANHRERRFEDFPSPIHARSPRVATPSTVSPRYSVPTCNLQPSYCSSTGTGIYIQDSPQSIWQDYPMVQSRVSPTYSVIDTMSCPAGRPAFVPLSGGVVSPAISPEPQQCNYQGSSLGNVFGGSRPLISPPKFTTNTTQPHFSPYIRYGAYYDVSATPIGVSTLAFNSQFLTNLSRSSSQSSGFVSQQGGIASPQPTTSNGTAFCI